MKFSEIQNCKDCQYEKCLLRTDQDFSICPVEAKKRELENAD